jgi:hypothetical protein
VVNAEQVGAKSRIVHQFKMTIYEYQIAVMLHDNTAELLEYKSEGRPKYTGNRITLDYDGFKFAVLSELAWQRTGMSFIGLGHTALAAWKDAYKKFY